VHRADRRRPAGGRAGRGAHPTMSRHPP
jgi:hypothetical protein